MLFIKATPRQASTPQKMLTSLDLATQQASLTCTSLIQATVTSLKSDKHFRIFWAKITRSRWSIFRYHGIQWGLPLRRNCKYWMHFEIGIEIQQLFGWYESPLNHDNDKWIWTKLTDTLSSCTSQKLKPKIETDQLDIPKIFNERTCFTLSWAFWFFYWQWSLIQDFFASILQLFHAKWLVANTSNLTMT